MEYKNAITWDDVPEEIKVLVEFGVYTEEEVFQKLNNPVHSELISNYKKPVYATKSNMTKKEAEFLFVHQGHRMNEWKLEMLLENGYALEANDNWNSFIKDLLYDQEITKRQYDNWLDRFKH